ncbi:hypothetical protein GOODEAATRI_024479 [Goodea atripinnis]|uniref:Uncharacterized protein n=1 Tax=Goodea atripinnis TaxID=208336 RepID=A0ABV0NDA3_9TELE
MLVVSMVVLDGVEHPEEVVEPAGHREMCATSAVSLDIGHAPAPTGGHSREYQNLRFPPNAGYSRNYVPGYTELAQPLRDLAREQGMRNLNNVFSELNHRIHSIRAGNRKEFSGTTRSSSDIYR